MKNPNHTITLLFLFVFCSVGNCFGDFIHDFGKVYRLHEKLVFTFDSKRLLIKYTDFGMDPDHLVLADTAADPRSRYDHKIEELSGNLNESIQSIKNEKDVSFEDAVKMISFCSTRMMGSLIFVVDQVWPTKGNEIRKYVDQEINQRGPEGDIYASLRRGYVINVNGKFIYKETNLFEILKRKNETQ